jgi:hypothetical protein
MFPDSSRCVQASGANGIREVLNTIRTVPFAGRGLPATSLKFRQLGFQKFKIVGSGAITR